MKKSLLIIVVAVGLLGGGGAFFLVSHGGKSKKKEAPKVPPVTVKLDEFVANLADKTTAHYIKLSMAMEIEGAGGEEKVAAAIKEQTPYIRDSALMILSKQKYNDLLSEDGKTALKKQLKEAFQETLKEQELKVSNILFTDMVLD
jgi:flagellar protein FliL